MSFGETIAELEVLYGAPLPTSTTKELDHLIPLTAEYIRAAPLVVVATPGPGGLDGQAHDGAYPERVRQTIY